MKRTHWIRESAAAAAAAVPAVALADSGITPTGWWSLLAVVGIAGVLFVVYKKVN